jgi:hypothetical protein
MATTKLGNIEMDVVLWGAIKGHITSKGYKKNSLWIIDAMKEKWLRDISPQQPSEKQAKETSESDLVSQAHNLKSRLELMARLASYRCKYDTAARLGALETKAAARFERRLNKQEWAK